MTMLVLRVMAVLCSLGTAGAFAQTPTPTPGGDCCETHVGVGCDIDACAACVCVDQAAPECCAEGFPEGWDQICVALAASDDCSDVCLCGLPPTPTPTPGGDCCTAHAGSSCDEVPCTTCVCDVDPECCAGVWDATCVSIARTVGDCAGQCTTCTPFPTPPPDVSPTPGSCCEGRDLNPGCNEPVCEACVCGVDGVCCSDTWDDSCVVIAAEECALACICETDGECCSAHQGLGCNDRTCQDCVLAVDAECGDVWDGECASEAAVECALECPCGDCCADQGNAPGCGEKTCQGCVCAMDPTCCDPQEGWDARCSDIASNECSLDCPCGDCCEAQEPGSEVVGCGEKPCQDCVCALDSNCCDSEWDGICAARALEECDRRCSCDAVNDCCVSREGEAGCGLADCEACVCGQDSFCCDDFWDTRCAEELTASAECAAACMCSAVSSCVGDCNGDGMVAINELIIGVRISLGDSDLSACPAFDPGNDGAVSISELIQGVNRALDGC